MMTDQELEALAKKEPSVSEALCELEEAQEKFWSLKADCQAAEDAVDDAQKRLGYVLSPFWEQAK
jgi:hypothetical protein